MHRILVTCGGSFKSKNNYVFNSYDRSHIEGNTLFYFFYILLYFYVLPVTSCSA